MKMSINAQRSSRSFLIELISTISFISGIKIQVVFCAGQQMVAIYPTTTPLVIWLKFGYTQSITIK